MHNYIMADEMWDLLIATGTNFVLLSSTSIPIGSMYDDSFAAKTQF